MTRTFHSIALCLVAAGCAGTGAATAPDAAASVPVIRVLDGDSLMVEIAGREAEVRLLGVNTPERDECYHQEATAVTSRLAGGRVRLGGGDEDRFGRLLRYAYANDGTLVNAQLVADGLALALTVDHPLLNDFKSAEAEAFRRGIGRWQPDACGPATTADVSISQLEYDAPGDDTQNRNGEWLEITNNGTDPVNLHGWAVHDESSSHRFRFPDGFTLAPGKGVRLSSGCGTPSGDQLFWCDDDPVWSNGGDTAYLLDPSGNVVDRYAF